MDVSGLDPKPVGGISLDPQAGALPLEQPGGPSGPDAGLLGAVAGAMGVLVLGSAAWYARRRRRVR